MINYGIALKKPFSDLRKSALGLSLSIVAFMLPYFAFGNAMLASVLSLIAFFVGLLVTGYYARVAVDTMKKSHKLPAWTDWKDLMMKGAYVTILTFLYFIPLIVIFAIVLGFPLPRQPEQLDFSNISALGMAALLVVSLVMSYVMPSAIMSYLKHNKFRYAFRAKEVLGKLVSKNYFSGWFVSFIYLLFVTVLFSFVPFVGMAVSNFIAGVTVMSIMAEAYISH